MIKGVLENISMQIIFRFLHRSEFQLLANTAEINYRVNEMQKVKVK